jgi:polyhydroxyalkanoate synthase
VAPGEVLTGRVPPGLSDGAPGYRIGEPSPLILHLGAALSAYTFALLVAPRADSPDFRWAGSLADEAKGLGGLDQIEVAHDIARRLTAMLAGIDAWQRHPYRRALADPPAIWEAGCSRLLDYGATPEAADPAGPPVLVLPSLINRAYILDLLPGRSMLRWLATQGLRPLLLDWGTPGREEAGFDLADYGRERLMPALAAARRLGGAPVPVMGYCMGGTLAVGLAARRPDDVSALVTIGAPWDFTSTRGMAGGCRAAIRAEGADDADRLIDGLGAAFGLVPVGFLQTVFALVNPMQAALKFQKLARLDPNGAAARHFVAIEDWLSDGVPMPAEAAKDLLVGWQIRNRTARGEWHFLGGRVDPGRVSAPALVFCGERDTIAPPALATPLGAALPRARTVRPQTGHVGMVVGSVARPQIWRPAAAFLAAHRG